MDNEANEVGIEAGQFKTLDRALSRFSTGQTLGAGGQTPTAGAVHTALEAVEKQLVGLLEQSEEISALLLGPVNTSKTSGPAPGNNIPGVWNRLAGDTVRLSRLVGQIEAVLGRVTTTLR
jgi:hypothetical protein